MNCPNCGTFNNNGSNFCIRCGHRLLKENSDTNNQVTIEKQSIEQQLMQNQNANIDYGKQINKKKFNIKKPLIILVIAIVTVCFGLIIFYFFSKKVYDYDNGFDITKTTAFFLKNENKKYALFNKNGDQLSDFIFTGVSSFINGTADIMIDDKYGIINENGKFIVETGLYEFILRKGGLYEVHQNINGEYKKYLINGHGKILYDLSDVKVTQPSLIEEVVLIESEEDKKYTLINYEGKEMTSFSIVEGVEEPSIYDYDEMIIGLFYNNNNLFFNAKTGKQISSFSSDSVYSVSYSSEDKKIFILSTYGDLDDREYKIIKNGKVYDNTNDCDQIYMESDRIYCDKDYITYILDSNFNIEFDIEDKIYKDSRNYAINKSGNSYGVDFYENGKLVKSVPCQSLKQSSNDYNPLGIYLLSSEQTRECRNDNHYYSYYKSNGEKLNDKQFSLAEDYDVNNLARVSNDRKNFYLIDKNGVQVSSIYDSISVPMTELSRKYYYVEKNNLDGLLDSSGKEILPCNYKNISVPYSDEKKYIIITTKDSKYILYDLFNNEEIRTFDAKPFSNNNQYNGLYFTVSSNGKTEYYTYNGKKIYETK